MGFSVVGFLPSYTTSAAVKSFDNHGTVIVRNARVAASVSRGARGSAATIKTPGHNFPECACGATPFTGMTLYSAGSVTKSTPHMCLRSVRSVWSIMKALWSPSLPTTI
jgi:hypothetical protein